jgi:hypothetical protein
MAESKKAYLDQKALEVGVLRHQIDILPVSPPANSGILFTIRDHWVLMDVLWLSTFEQAEVCGTGLVG